MSNVLYISRLEQQAKQLRQQNATLKAELEEWQYQMAYYTKEDKATPKATYKFVDEALDKIKGELEEKDKWGEEWKQHYDRVLQENAKLKERLSYNKIFEKCLPECEELIGTLKVMSNYIMQQALVQKFCSSLAKEISKGKE